MALPVYSSRDVLVSWSGVPITGFTPDSFINFSRNVDLTDEEVGASGELSTSINPDRTGNGKISLQQQSPSNLLLSGILNAQDAGGALVIGNLTITDPSGSTLALLSGAYLKVAPEISLGSTATGSSRDWTFFVEHLNFTSSPDGLI